MLSSRVVIHFAIVCFVNPNYGLERSQEISATTDAIRHVVNDIISSLKIIMNKSNKIKKYSAIHEHFVKLTQHGNDSWNEVLKSSRHDVKIDNGSADFTTVINEVLNDENKAEGASDLLNGDNANRCIENFLSTLKILKENYLFNNSDSTENNEVLQLYYKDRNNTRDNAKVSSENGVNESGVWVPSETRRIFHGERTKIQNYPFVVSVHLLNQFTCAGSIIYADLVITAASCLQLLYNNRFFRENPLSLTVRVGSSYYDVGGEVIPVVEVYFHPLYDPPTLRNNLAIMRLHRRIKFSKKERKIKLIEIDHNNWALPPNTAGITLLGWGSKNTLNKLKVAWQDKLSEAELDYYPIYECQKIYPKSQVMDKSFCAGFFSQGGGACNRDVGGPGVVHGQLVGVVSFGAASCGATAAPTVFTKVGFYADWIESIMEQTPARHKAETTTRRRPYFYHTIEATMELADKRFSIQPILRSTTEYSRETNLRTLYDEQFKEFLRNKHLSEKPNAQESTVNKQANDENKRHARKKTTENTESLEDADRITRGFRSSTDISFDPKTYLDIEELYGLSSPDKEFAKKRDKVMPAPGPMISTETDREQAVVNSKIRTKPNQNNISTNYSVLLQQILLLESEHQTISSNSLEVEQNTLAEPERNALQNLILALGQPSGEDFEAIKENSQPKYLQNFEGSELKKQHSSEGFNPETRHNREGFHPETQQNPESFHPQTQHSPEGFDLKTQYSPEGFHPKEKHRPEGFHPETQHSLEGFDRKTQYSPEGFDPKTRYRPEGFDPKIQNSHKGSEPKKKHSSEGFHPETQHNPESFHPETQHSPEGFDSKTQYSPEGFHPKTKHRPEGFHPETQHSPEDFDQKTQYSPEGFHPKKQHHPEGFHPETQHSPESFDRKIEYSPKGLHPKKQHLPEGFQPETQHSPEGFDPNTQYSPEGFHPNKQYSPEGFDPKTQYSPQGFDTKIQYSPGGFDPKIRYSPEGFDPNELNSFIGFELKKHYSARGVDDIQLNTQHRSKEINDVTTPSKKKGDRLKIDGTNYEYEVHNLKEQHGYEQKKQLSSDARNEVIRPPRMKIDGIGLSIRKPLEPSMVRQLDNQIETINMNVNKVANSNVVKRTQSTDIAVDTKIQEYLKHQEQKENPARNSDILSKLYSYAGEY